MGITEQSLIGAILSKNAVLADVASIVNVEDFRDIKSQEVYTLCLERWKEDKTTDLYIAASTLMGKVDMAWLADSTSCGFPVSAIDYAREIAEEAKVSRLRKELSILSSSSLDSQDLISSMSNLCLNEESASQEVSDNKEAISEFSKLRKAGGLKGLSTGFHFLDSKNIKLVRGNYWAVGAATTVGKTALAMNMLAELLDQNAKVAVISTEMTKAQMVSRLVAHQTDLPAFKIFENNLRSEFDFEKVEKAEDYLSKKTFFMSDRISEISEIENTVKGLNMKHDLDVVFIDYIQHCTSRGFTKQFDVVTDVSNRIQKLAKSVDACTVALSQISHSANRQNKESGEPVIEFKGSGAVGEDCDVGIIMTKLTKGEPGVSEEEVKRTRMATVVKNRHGMTGRNALQFTKEYSRLQEIHDKDNY